MAYWQTGKTSEKSNLALTCKTNEDTRLIARTLGGLDDAGHTFAARIARMPKVGFQLIAVAMLSVPLMGCAINVGNAQPFDVTGVGNGATLGEATREAWRDAAEKIRLQGYERFQMDDTSTVTRGSEEDVEVEMRFEVTPRD
jgi:hypothetical protein